MAKAKKKAVRKKKAETPIAGESARAFQKLEAELAAEKETVTQLRADWDALIERLDTMETQRDEARGQVATARSEVQEATDLVKSWRFKHAELDIQHARATKQVEALRKSAAWWRFAAVLMGLGWGLSLLYIVSR